MHVGAGGFVCSNRPATLPPYPGEKPKKISMLEDFLRKFGLKLNKECCNIK
jgi:hypothetical protein